MRVGGSGGVGGGSEVIKELRAADAEVNSLVGARGGGGGGRE